MTCLGCELKFTESFVQSFCCKHRCAACRATTTPFRRSGTASQGAGTLWLAENANPRSRANSPPSRFAIRRSRRRWMKIGDPHERARTLTAIACQVVEQGVRNVAIVDYYLKHVTDAAQLRRLDRWLAEEILSRVFGGHKKGNFAKISYEQLRRYGLPSLVHRQRLILHGKIESPFFIWQQQKADRAFKGTVASRKRAMSAASDFSPCPEAAAHEKACERGRPPVHGCDGITCR